MRTTPWCNKNEFRQVYSGLFQTGDRNESVNTLKLWLNRGNCPHSIESTLSLMESLDMTTKGDISQNQKQLLMSIAIIRFVNGLVDPLQQFSFARSIHDLAKQIDLPLKFVQLRHTSTHDNLPSLKVLTQSTIDAVDWLRTRYWDVVLSTLEESNSTVDSMETRLEALNSILTDDSPNESGWTAASNFKPSAIGLLNNKKSNLYLYLYRMAQRFIDQGLNILRRVGGGVEKALGSYKEPVFYNAQVGKELFKQVYQAEKLSPPSSFSQVASTWSNIFAKAAQRQTYVQLFESGQWSKVAVIGLEAYGIFKLGEIIGKRKLVGYGPKAQEHH
ncbi:Las1-domain-containing protein [Wallemia mellicola]|nr:Las1-domain-containing protein [Wallemia mellicola]